MSEKTAARPERKDDSHWYSCTGEPCYTVMGKTTNRPRPTNIQDARAQNLLPSVTTILNVLHKEGLVAWKIETAVLAVITTPRLPNEKDDAFIERVLHVEQHQEAEGKAARDKGTEIHEALEMYMAGEQCPKELEEWIVPAAEKLLSYGKVVVTEKILVGNGYAGKTDLLLEAPDCYWLIDYKSAKKLPKAQAWPEHRLQLSAYAKAQEDEIKSMGIHTDDKPIKTANIYISSLKPGEFLVCEHDEWSDTFDTGFLPLLIHWQWANKYVPVQARPALKLGNYADLPAEALGFVAHPPIPPVRPTPPEIVKGHKVVWTGAQRVTPLIQKPPTP